MTAPAKNIDWAAVHAAYVVGIESVRSIGERFGVSHVAIGKKARTEGWTRADSRKVLAMIDSIAEAEASGLPRVTRLPALVTELDRLSDLKLMMEDNARAIAAKIPQMLANIETMQELQQASVAHRNLHDTHFKAAPDSQTNVQINNALPAVSVTFGD